jgi:prepilin-type processing-associated H-X9-DG protein
MYARSAAYRALCQNNLRQIGVATHQHVSVKGGFPPLWSYSLFWSQGKQTGSLSDWTPYLFPYLEQENLANTYDMDKMFYENTEAIARPLKVLQCPSAPRAFETTTEQNWAPSQVSGNSDLAILDPILSSSFTAATADYTGFAKVSDDWKELLSYPSDFPSLVGVLASPPYPSPQEIAGYFIGGTVNRRAILRKPSEITDGMSNTILFVEDAGRPQFWEYGKLVDPEDSVRNSGWADPAGSGQQIRGDLINQCLINCNNRHNIYAFHRGGANFPFADGSVRFISTSVTNRTLVALLTESAGDQVDCDY